MAAKLDDLGFFNYAFIEKKNKTNRKFSQESVEKLEKCKSLTLCRLLEGLEVSQDPLKYRKEIPNSCPQKVLNSSNEKEIRINVCESTSFYLKNQLSRLSTKKESKTDEFLKTRKGNCFSGFWKFHCH